MGRRRTILLSIGALALVSAAGCGSGGDDSTASLTKAAFVKQADAICSEGKQQEIKAFTTYMVKSQQQNLKGTAQARYVVGGALQPIEKTAKEIDELGAPEGDEAQVSEIVDALEGLVEEGRKDPKKTLTSSAPYRKPDKLAAAYGLKACSEF